MTERELGAAVIGTGFGFLTHMRALREAGIRVEALVGRDPKKTAERARRGRIPNALTDLDEALRLPGVDLVTIATPPHSHAEIAIRACEAGKHVMCEKPFAANLEQAEAMLAAAERAGVVHALGCEFRFSTGQAVATRAIREGAIGAPKLATFILMHPGLADPKSEVPEWWGSREDGGGWFGAYASHVIDQMRMMLGEWEGVSASLDLVSAREWTAEDSFTIHFRTKGGCSGILQSSCGTLGPGAGLSRVSGPQGTLSILGDDVSIADASGERQLEVPPELANPAPDPCDPALLTTAYDMLHSMGIDIAPFTKLFVNLRDAIRGERTGGERAGSERTGGAQTADPPENATFHDGVVLQRIMDAIRRSAATGSWERLP